MELYAKGQLSFLILNCLLERDFYGLDIITEINIKSNGNINLKKPSVYSNLTRMEKQGYVSSYMRSSDLGPNRKYYSITELGRTFFDEINDYFTRNNIDVFSEFNDGEEAPATIQNSIFETNTHFEGNETYEESKTLIAQETEPNSSVFSKDNKIEGQDDFFDFSSVENEINEDELNTENDIALQRFKQEENREISDNFENEDNFKQIEKNEIAPNAEFEKVITPRPYIENDEMQELELDKQQKIYSSQTQESSYDSDAYSIKNALRNSSREHSLAENIIENKDDAVFITRENAEEYNKRLYDISKDIKGYKKRRSFAEDQISITIDTPLTFAHEKVKANIEDFKNSLMENKGYPQEKTRDTFNQFTSFKEKYEKFGSETQNEMQIQEDKKDDGKFIYEKISPDSIEKPRKIAPPHLKIVSDGGKEKLPPPNRDVSIDPSHQEILSKLYSKTKDNTNEQREDSLYDYSDLKDYYKNQNIAFNAYEKSNEVVYHNTNKIYFIVSLLSFILLSAFSALTYVILMKTNLLNPTYNFLYILLPSLALVDVISKIYNMVVYKGWLPKQIMQQWQLWLLSIILLGAVTGLNFCFGLNGIQFAKFATTLILPSIFIIVKLPIRYYLKRVLFVKCWK